MKTKQELRQYFENGDIPKQEEFWEWQESYWHKDEKIPLDKLAYDFSQKADLVGGVVPASQLPSYVDDVLEFNSLSDLPPTGESGKIYIAKDTNKLYRWTGTRYIDITQGELATLQSATDRGNETTRSIKVQGVGFGGSDQSSNILIGDDVDGLNSRTMSVISIGKNTKPNGTDSIIIGHSSNLQTDSFSSGNTIIGNYSCSKNISSNNNTVIGHGAFSNSTKSSGNTIIGAQAANSGGDENTMNIIVGQNAGAALAVASKNNIIIGNNSNFKGAQLKNSLYIHNNSQDNPVTLSDALISGNFISKYVNVNGKFSITPNQMPASDASYTKNIVARPDGTFGWEDKVNSEYVPLIGTDFNKPVTGDIYIRNSTHYTMLSKGYVNCSDNSDNSILVDSSMMRFIEGGTEIAGVSKNGLFVYGPEYNISCHGTGARGLSGAYDYTPNVKELDYIQKKYADKQHSYTTKEELTNGTWINGKPVYKKTLYLNQIPRTGEIDLRPEFPDLETIISNEMFTEWDDLKAVFAGNQWRTKAYITIERHLAKIELMNAPDYNYSLINSFTLTLEYTKKSDLPLR